MGWTVWTYLQHRIPSQLEAKTFRALAPPITVAYELIFEPLFFCLLGLMTLLIGAKFDFNRLHGSGGIPPAAPFLPHMCGPINGVARTGQAGSYLQS